MLFRNLVLFKLPADWSMRPLDLEEALAQRPLRPCGGFDMQTRGFVPCGETQRLVYAQGGHYLLALGVHQKLLPASVVNQEARDRAVALAESQGHPVGRRQMRELKARVADELRARALVRRRVTYAWVNTAARWLAVNTSSIARAEELVDALRDALEGLGAVPLASRQEPAACMARWLGQADVPGRFAIDQELELRATDGGGALVRYMHHPLDGAEIRSHLAGGKTPVRLGLSWNDRIAFVLNQGLQIRCMQFLDAGRDEYPQGQDPQEQFDADFALMTGELSQMLEELITALGGAAEARERAADGGREERPDDGDTRDAA